MSDEINDPIAALGSEFSRVSVSPEFAVRVRERLADDLEPLRAELAELTPSPEFAVRVRQSIEGGRQGFSWSRLNWRWMVPVSGLAAGAVIAAVVLRPADVSEPSTTARVIPKPPSVEEQVVTPSAPVRPRAVQTVARPTSSATLAARPGTPRDPMLEVITDQPEILRKLWVRVDSGIAVDSTEPTGTYQTPKLAVPQIEVSPIVTFLVPDLRVPVGLTPVILRMTADEAERSPR